MTQAAQQRRQLADDLMALRARCTEATIRTVLVTAACALAGLANEAEWDARYPSRHRDDDQATRRENRLTR